MKLYFKINFPVIRIIIHNIIRNIIAWSNWYELKCFKIIISITIRTGTLKLLKILLNCTFTNVDYHIICREKENINRQSHRNHSHIKGAMLSAIIFLKLVSTRRIHWCVYDLIKDYLESLISEFNVDFLKGRLYCLLMPPEECNNFCKTKVLWMHIDHELFLANLHSVASLLIF